jgi:ABC-type antimicrobial peptide transport system permease subunit
LPIAGLRYVTPGYFHALGIRVIRGRGFTAADIAGAPRVVVINETLAHRYFQDRDPLGTQLDRGTIVGVVADVPQSAVDRAPEPDLYHPAAQAIAMTSDLGMSLIVRTAGASEPLIDAVRAAVRQVNPKLAIFNVKTMEQVVADSLWALNLYRWLIGLFAALTLAITVIGVYGVTSYNATSRTREFAVRLAIGSDPAGLTRLVLARAARLAAGGLTAGILGALAATPALRTLPLASGARPLTYAAVAVSLVMIALLASLVPAMRLRSIDPAAALRHD